ncbi:MAG: SBBP repeat-containing protein [Pyrinomonadaceae bacterium]|nr:SBBP repeat-containing protein [Pyrinomonadaceae bacterium]
MKTLSIVLVLGFCIFAGSTQASITLSYSTFINSTGNVEDVVRDAAFDSQGNIYVTGGTRSPNFQTTNGAFDTSFNGVMDIFVRKYSPSGTLIWSTFIGGNAYDRAYAIEVDSAGNVYIGGRCSTNCPTTTGVVQPNFGGDDVGGGAYGQQDGYVAKFNTNGNLLWATYYGSSGPDFLRDIAIDPAGNVYLAVAALTRQFTAPGNPNSFDSTYNGGLYDGQVVKLNSTGTAVVYYGHIGGSGEDCNSPSIRANAAGEAFMLCQTKSTNAYVSSGAPQLTHAVDGGKKDLYIVKINSAGNSIAWATYLGGDGDDDLETHNLGIDSASNVYVAAFTKSSNIPGTAGGFQSVYRGGGNDALISKIAADGRSFIQNTYLGGTGDDGAEGVFIDSNGKVIVSGFTVSTNFPVTADAIQPNKSGGYDGTIVRFNSNLTALEFSTHLGGSGNDSLRSADMFGNRSIHGGVTVSSNYPVTSGASYQGQDDGVVSVIDYGTVTAPQMRSKFDFDGDNKSDLSIYRPASGQWWFKGSKSGVTTGLTFGTAPDKPVAADFTGDGKTDVAIWRPSSGEWFVLRSEDSTFYSFPFGTSSDTPLSGDYDGDGKADAALFRAATGNWFINRSSGGTSILSFGTNGDKAVSGDFDGDGKDDLVVYRAAAGEWWISKSTGGIAAFQFGNASDIPVPGDFTGDSKTDVAIWRPSTGEWFILRSESGTFYSFPFGTAGDIPVRGDFDGDGKVDSGVFRPSNATWYLNRSQSGLFIAGFGAVSDVPVPSL